MYCNLINRVSGDVFQRNYESSAFLQEVKGVLELFIEYLMGWYAEFTPIDEVANAVLANSRHFNSKYTVFYIDITKVLYFEKPF